MRNKIIGVCLIAFALFGHKIPYNQIVDFVKVSVNTSYEIGIEEPALTPELNALVDPIDKSVTDKKDRLKLAIFLKNLSEESLNMNGQQFNDFFTSASRGFYGDSMKGKYPSLSISMENLFKSVIKGAGPISTDQQADLKMKLRCAAWKLSK